MHMLTMCHIGLRCLEFKYQSSSIDNILGRNLFYFVYELFLMTSLENADAATSVEEVSIVTFVTKTTATGAVFLFLQ